MCPRRITSRYGDVNILLGCSDLEISVILYARIGSGLDRLNSISSTMVDVLQVSK
jgi:hypothetical protein